MLNCMTSIINYMTCKSSTYNEDKSAYEQAARVRACNSVNLKPGGIIELLLKIVNVLRMCPGFGVAHSDQPAQHGYGRVRSVGAFE